MIRFRYVRYCTLSDVWDYWRNEADGDAQQIRKCRGAWVALCTQTTHTGTDRPSSI
jgi:hypothetical protein